MKNVTDLKTRKLAKWTVISASLLGLALSSVISAQTFVQQNYATPQSAQTTVSVPFAAAQAVGDFNVIAVGWNDTAAGVSSVKDSSGNVYTLAVGPTRGTGLSQSLYYAPNIAAAAAGANSVTVTFSQAAQYPDIRILEYKGLSALDGKLGATGNGSTANSGAVTTTTANELVFGAGMVSTNTTGAGSGFTSRVITSPDGDIAEDKAVTATGSYSATAALNAGDWVMQMATFTVAGGTTGSPAVSLTPASISFGNQPVGITSATQVVTLKNTGTASLTINSITIPTGNTTDFGQNNSCGTSLAAGSSCTINVTFTPQALNARSATLSVSDNATGSPHKVTLSGTGTAASCAAHSVSLTWVASTTSDVNSYNLYRCTGSGCTPATSIGSVGSLTTTFVDSHVASGSTYGYGATAVDVNGESLLSNITTVTVP